MDKKRINFKKRVETIIVPVFLKGSFQNVGGLSTSVGTYFFNRTVNGKQQNIILGRGKFGKSFSFAVNKEIENGKYCWMMKSNFFRNKNEYNYSTQEELDSQLIIFLEEYHQTILEWLQK